MAARVLPGGLVLIACLGSIRSLMILGMVQFSRVIEKLRPVPSPRCEGGGCEEGCRDSPWLCGRCCFGVFELGCHSQPRHS